jgi:protein farnesyltransferase/geranylgeranyltransferase type-1 subunit alpha
MKEGWCPRRDVRDVRPLLARDPTMSLQLIRSFIANIFLSPFHFLRVTLLRLRNGLTHTNTLQRRMPPSKFYHDDEAWKDVAPLPQDDGGMHPLAAIAYTEEYSEAMGYLRAVMANNEFSERVLGLTEHIINMNPAHYTVWCVIHTLRSNTH